MVDLLVPPPEDTGPGKLTVGKVYGGMLILENWKLSRFGQGFNTNNDVPYSQSNGGGHNGVCLRMKDTAATMKSSLVTGDRTGDSVTPSKQRLSVQFPVRMDSDLRLVYFTLSLVTNDTILAKALLSSMQMI